MLRRVKVGGRWLGTPFLVVALLLAPGRARADAPEPETPLDAALIWGIAAFEIAETAALILRIGVWPGDMQEGVEPLLLTAPLFLGASIGTAEYFVRAPSSIAKAGHGGLWTGIAVGLATGLVRAALRGRGPGMLLDGISGLAALGGTLPGIVLGATSVEGSTETKWWLAAPPAGFMIGVILAGVILVGSFVVASDPGPRVGGQLVGWPIFAGLSGGLAVASAFALDD